MEISEYYSKRENCISELATARKVWGSTASTDNEWEGVGDALGFMVLYCPDDLSHMVNAHFNEFMWRNARRRTT